MAWGIEGHGDVQRGIRRAQSRTAWGTEFGGTTTEPCGVGYGGVQGSLTSGT